MKNMLFTTALRRLRYAYAAPSLDHFVFKLCYKWTVILLVAFSFVVTCRLLFGNSFSCTAAVAAIDFRLLPADFVNSRCYDDAVYTLPAKLIVAKRHEELHEEDDSRRYQSYYSWANLLLLVHALNFYLPHLLWESYERGRVHRLTAGIRQNFSEGRDLELCHLAKYVLVTRGGHRLYALTYVALEILNCVVSLVQALWLVHFFGVTGVPDFLQPHALGTWSDFRNFYFPPEGICELKASGAASSSSGGVERYTVLCHLPLNALYMNMFLFLYAWYIFLAALCGLVPVYRILLLVSPLRMFAAVRLSPNPLIERPVLLTVCDRLSYSDWFFVFSRLQRAMSDVDFAEMVDKIALALSQGDESRQTYAYKRSLTTLEDAPTKEDSDIITDMISPV